jgi:hypothetical protein
MPAARNKPRTSQYKAFPAPTGGWIANRNLATPNQYGQQPGAAVLENWFPLATSAVMRRGSQQYAVIGTDGTPVTALFAYVNGNNSKLFAANETAIYDITTVLQPDDLWLVDGDGNFLVDDDGEFFIVAGTPPAEDGTGTLTGGDWSVVQFETAGGVFLRAVNGVDTPIVYDGSAWSTSPAITFTDGTTADQLNNVWTSQSRMWFVKADSMTAYYLDPESIGGAANALPLGSVFTRGGSLLFGASWSIETLGGLNEHNVFVSTEGEVAVYQGTDPSSSTTWTLVGVYRIGRPLGPKAWIKAGGDLVIATDIGFVPLSQAMQRDYSALSPSAVSYPIETAWNDAVAERSNVNWNCEVWPTNQMVAVAPPTVSGTSPEIYVANARTGAWAKFTGWDANCLCVWESRMFFGTRSGKVIEANVTGADLGAPYTGTYIPLFDDLRSPGSIKIAKMARAVLREGVPIAEKVSINVDFDTTLPAAPDATVVSNVSAWGTAVWGVDTWGKTLSLSTQQNWQAVGAAGYTLAPCVQVTSGDSVPLDTQIVRFDVTYDTADVVT